MITMVAELGFVWVVSPAHFKAFGTLSISIMCARPYLFRWLEYAGPMESKILSLLCEFHGAGEGAYGCVIWKVLIVLSKISRGKVWWI